MFLWRSALAAVSSRSYWPSRFRLLAVVVEPVDVAVVAAVVPQHPLPEALHRQHPARLHLQEQQLLVARAEPAAGAHAAAVNSNRSLIPPTADPLL